MTNLILPRRRKLLVPSFAAGLAAASPAMGHNGSPPITDQQVATAVEQAKGAGVVAPWGTLPSDPTLAMFMMARLVGTRSGGGGAAAVSVSDVFKTSLVAGIFSDEKVTTGIDMATHGGLVWAKERNNSTRGHFLIDTLRGGTKRLASNSTSPANTAQYVDSFESDGFWADGAGNVSDPILSAGNDHVVWSFRRAPKFFDVVTWTGNGSARTLSHALGVTPGLITVKRLDSSGQWVIYHRTQGGTKFLGFDTSASQTANTIWNDTDPTSSVFSLGTDATVNAFGGTYVAYLFAHDPSADGLVVCGDLTANFNDPGYFGSFSIPWPVQYLLVKSANYSSDWLVFDTARGFSASQNYYPNLRPNSIAAETSSNGLSQNQPETVSLYDLPTVGQWIYLAIRAAA